MQDRIVAVRTTCPLWTGFGSGKSVGTGIEDTGKFPRPAASNRTGFMDMLIRKINWSVRKKKILFINKILPKSGAADGFILTA